MGGEGFAERFKRLEIPEEKRRDLGFVDAAFAVPAPLPLEPHALLVLAGGRALVPVEDEATAADAGKILLHDRWHALREVESPETAEKSFLGTHATALAREAKRFIGGVPAAVLGDPDRIAAAVERLTDAGPGPVLGALVGDARLLRLHGKLYDLKTLREYERVFEKAIDPALFRELQAFPDTTPPEAVLARIERSLDQVHAKARSPLRNKMATSRIVKDGVTLLPIYREEAKGLFDEYRRRLERRLKRDALERLAGRSP